MFKRIELENYQSFEHISLDLTGSHDSPLRHAFIYGENGSGKTNLMGSIRFLKDSIDTLGAMDFLSALRESLEAGDADEKDSVKKAASDLRKAMVCRTKALDLQAIAASRRLIGSDAPMRAAYRFNAGPFDTAYEMVFDKEGRLIREELRQRSGQRISRLFLVESTDGGPKWIFARGMFKKAALTRRVTAAASRNWGPHSMMAIIKEEYSKSNPEFMAAAMDASVKRVLDFIDSVSTNIMPMNPAASCVPCNLVNGQCFSEEKRVMEAYGHALSRFFSRLYSDVFGAHYVFVEDEGGIISYDLMFEKRIAGAVREIPARLESSGTRSLISLFPSLMRCSGGEVAFIDEMDQGVHDKLVYDLMKEILPDIKGQLIATTHNTTLLEAMDPKNVFVLRVDAKGFKDTATLHSICRTQRNNNNRHRYLGGQFDAVPIIGLVDIAGIYDGFKEDLEGA